MTFAGKHVHLVGIGGAGVGALAPLLRAAGATVSGCDAVDSPGLRALRANGVNAQVGHDPAHLAGVDVVVHTSAVGGDHPELAGARARGIPVLGRAACLVDLMTGTRTVAVAGSHGKTSTTWFLGHLLAEAGCDPVVMVGGGVAALGGGGARTGRGSLFVAETDESDGSFALVRPEIAIVTNLDHEHLRHYGSFAGLERAFNTWLRAIPASGAAILPVAGLSPTVAAGLGCRVVRVGLDAGDVHARDLALGADGSRCRVVMDGEDLGEITIPIPGAHMVANALMAVAAARLAAPGCRLDSLARCERVRRRFTVHGSARGVRVVEDYGHHPSEVRATIAAARLAGGRVHVAFQPHRYSRTADCFTGFTVAFDQAHAVAILPIYAAGEPPIPGIDHRDLAAAIAGRRSRGDEDTGLAVAAEPEPALDFLAANARAGDTCLVLGAGDVGNLAGPLLLRLAATASLSTTSVEARWGNGPQGAASGVGDGAHP